ncbi:hypothetical protein ASPWEDRAFT_167620 [Aspergillus wentii DTO 134E9]|uniref:Acyl-CoA dehydrogenase/oxidase C-terminal domain-containing protein n=1 Tax=Aspergillus wentii DTO 134E9 TaxID=1073089 RepID=A0A1L9S379_ASPWE|nr:uncharacterized protein ASPWEDRAFT_167620 [Aspergillus wentii DTO 134E9]KAI9929955.1 hypothetical protein MW887_011765 [Aspergillus wentii]OJJ41608.1 hypothetical protein ASPWEDRAFT_167620 [Aspergillus wentii DTO 134E9]
MAGDSSHTSPPSSGTSGFFQQTPRLTNSFYEDESYKRVFSFYLPPSLQNTLAPDLSGFGTRVIDRRVFAHVADAERNTPYLKTWDSFGHRVDTLVTSEGWRSLSAMGIAEGIVAIPYENQYGLYSRVYQFLKYHLWAGGNAIVTCPSAMTDGAAKMLARQLAKGQSLSEMERQVFDEAYRRLVSRDPEFAWTSGQWMTERPGGSDVRNTETQATHSPAFTADESRHDTDGQPLGPWEINGFKWFSSATDSQMSVLLAKMPDGTLSAFYAPMRRQSLASLSSDISSPETDLNGVQIHRLKSKLGTRALPTAELVLSKMRAYLIGSPGSGVKEISTILNITRVHNTVSSVGGWGRGLAISRAFARVRTTSGRLLIETPAHVRTMAHQHVEYRAMTHLAFFAVVLLGITENASNASAPLPSHLGIGSQSAVPARLLRLVTPLAKAVTARAAIAGLAECMESLGGVGYLENEDPELNIARIYRDSNVLSIWEGTTNVMADDVVRVLKGRDGSNVLNSLTEWVRTIANQVVRDISITEILLKATDVLTAYIQSESAENLKLNGRILLSRLGWLICATLLAADAARDGNEVAREVSRRWMERKERALYGFAVMEDGKDDVSKESVELDRRIVFGDSPPTFTGKAKI